MAHPWLASVTTTENDAAQTPLDPQVVAGLRAFCRGNAVKRAVLRALAPLATVDEVGRWADVFEALDDNSTGTVSVKAFAEELAKTEAMSSEEARKLAEAAAAATGDAGEEISYSAFLAACLSAHSHQLEEKQLKALFDKLDKEKKGTISLSQVNSALGDIVDVEALKDDFGDDGLSYIDFKWLVSRPQPGPNSVAGLRQLLGTMKGLDLAPNWRVATKRAKDELGEQYMEAARQENAAWRLWHRQKDRGELPDESDSDKEKDALSVVHGKCSGTSISSFTSAESQKDALKLVIELSSGDTPKQGPEASPACSDVTLNVGKGASSVSIDVNNEVPQVWQVATAEAKDGDAEAVRRENMAWRMWNKNELEAGSRQASPEPSTRDLKSTSALRVASKEME
eukprot:TRINITY_DN13851_c0_g1_i1.p1 TRINITY_DN13851_c0_g1~~TRINITY_DN13851_c0_g1_i1.p1  ORF type:complete len:435 (+),score=91.83 TRINITY_DN13851_c0_g1_i1:113-1306(+)